MPTIELENIGTFEFPEGTSDAEMLSEVDRIKSIHYKSKQEESDFSKGRVASGVASAARGLVEGIGQSISGLGRYAAGLTAAIPETVEPGTNPSAEEYQRNIESRQAESGLMKLGSDIQSGAREAYKTNPEYQGEFLADVVPSALGSTAAAAIAGAAGGPLAAAVQYGFSQAESQAQEAEAAGKPEHADLEFLSALPLGIASEATLGAAPAFWKIIKKLRQAGVDPKIVAKPLARLALETGAFEAGQETIEQGGQNVISKIHDPERGVFEGTGTAGAAGFVVGTLTGAGGALVGNMARRQALKRVEAQTAAKGAPATAQALASTATEVKPGKLDTSSIVREIDALNQNISNLKASQAAGVKVADEVNAAINAFADSLPEQSTPAPNAENSLSSAVEMDGNKRAGNAPSSGQGIPSNVQVSPEAQVKEEGTGVQGLTEQQPSTEKGVPNGKEEGRKEVQQEVRDVTATQEPVASTQPVPPSVVSAEQKLIDLTNEAVESEEKRKSKGLGISALGSSKSSDVILGPITDISSGSSKAEENWQNSIRKREPLLNRIRATADKLWHSMTREYPGLDTVDFAKELDIIYRTRISKDYNTRRAVDVINGITRDLGPKQYSVFNRILVYEDLLKDVEAGMYDGGKELPTGHEDEATLRGDLAKFQAIAESTPPIKKALAKRREFMDALRDTLVERGMLPETVKEDPRYFHHQVLLYLGEKNLQRKSKTFREWRSGWQKARVGSSLEYNREYVESEAAMIADAFSRLHLQELQAEMQATADITPDLKVLAESQGEGTTVKSIIPEGYTEWQPKKGSVFYPVQTISEKAMDEYLEGIRDLLPDDFKKAVAIGRKLPTWIIPNPLAEVLDNVSRRAATLPERLAFAGQGYWKRWTLYMPLRVAKFMINNQTGDIDFTIAAKPELFKWWKNAFKDLKRLHISKSSATGDVKKAIELGVIGSGWRASELPELSESDAFDAITGRNAGLMDKYFSFVQRMNDLREDTARLGAFRYMMNLQREGKRMWYGASDPKVVDALPTPEAKAAHVASDLYINYRRSSEFTDFVRSRIIPFAKWMIGNPARYVQLIRNIPVNEGSSAGRAVGAALAGATLRQTVRLGALYAMFNLWNHLLFPDEEREMGNARRQFHLILGRDKDGNIQTLRASGALSDIMGWFGAEDIPRDIASVLDGKKSPGDIMTDAYQSFISKAVNSALPFHKAAYEAVTQRSLFPNVFQPRSIRDRGEHISKLFSVGTVYKWLAGIPQSPETTDLGSLLFYTHDPGDAAYSSVRQMALEWARKHGKESPGIIPSERSNYLYFYKQALRYGDKDLAEKWKERYMSVGGKSEGLAQSVRRSDPLDAVSKNKFEFMRSLSEEEKAMVKRAQEWYRKVYKP